jgi:hypothetical protein
MRQDTKRVSKVSLLRIGTLKFLCSNRAIIKRGKERSRDDEYDNSKRLILAFSQMLKCSLMAVALPALQDYTLEDNPQVPCLCITYQPAMSSEQ